MSKPVFSSLLSEWCDRSGQSLRKLAMSADVHDSDLSRIKAGTKRVTREVLGKILNSELLEQTDRLAFIRAFLKDEVPDGDLREGESFRDHTEISFPRANISITELSPLDAALEHFRRLADKDEETKNWLLMMQRLTSGNPGEGS